MFKKTPPSRIEKRILGTYCARFKMLWWDEKEQVWRLAVGAEICRVLALWALQLKHTRFSTKKNASTAAAAILGLPATKGLGFIGDG